MHFLLAIIIAAIYYAAARNIRLLVDRAVPCGIAYGLVTLRRDELRRHAALGDRQHGRRRPAYITITGILVHMFLVGLPIALITRRGLR